MSAERALPVVAGRMEGTINDHIRRCQVLLADEQEKPNPDNALIGALCDSVRLARELSELMKTPVILDRRYSCVVCRINAVDPDNGFDTCESCRNKV